MKNICKSETNEEFNLEIEEVNSHVNTPNKTHQFRNTLINNKGAPQEDLNFIDISFEIGRDVRMTKTITKDKITRVIVDKKHSIDNHFSLDETRRRWKSTNDPNEFRLNRRVSRKLSSFQILSQLPTNK
jgi:hypothetical protein